MDSTNLYQTENYIVSSGNKLTEQLLTFFIQGSDLQYKNSIQRKIQYYVKETRTCSLLTSIDYIDVNFTFYQDKSTKKSFCYIRDILGLKPYQRMTNNAEFCLINFAKDNNKASSGRLAILNTIISRTTVSRRVRSLKGSLREHIILSSNQPKVLYIEMDEIHANLQHGGNKICPCAIVHERHIDEFSKKTT